MSAPAAQGASEDPHSARGRRLVLELDRHPLPGLQDVRRGGQYEPTDQRRGTPELVVDRDDGLEELLRLVVVPHLEADPGHRRVASGHREVAAAGTGACRIERRGVGGVVRSERGAGHGPREDPHAPILVRGVVEGDRDSLVESEDVGRAGAERDVGHEMLGRGREPGGRPSRGHRRQDQHQQRRQGKRDRDRAKNACVQLHSLILPVLTRYRRGVPYRSRDRQHGRDHLSRCAARLAHGLVFPG